MAPSAETLVGRDRELAEVDALIERAVSGPGAAMLVAGEPGVGKTRLLHEAAAAAETAGCTVARVRCWEGQAAFPLSLWRDALAEVDAARPVADVAWLADPAASSGLLGDIDSSGLRARQFATIGLAMRAAAARRPLVVLLDDVHLADPSSLDVLRLVTAQCASAPMAVIAAYRNTEVSEALGAAVAALPSGTRRLTLGPLDPDDVADLARALDIAPVDADLVALLMSHTAGNPFLVGELLRLRQIDGQRGIAGVPLGARHLLDRRLAGLSTRCRSALAVAAAAGGEFDADLVAAASGSGSVDVAAALDEAIGAGIVQSVGGQRYTFAHDLLRQVLYESSGRRANRRHHLAVAEALEARHGADLDVHVAELAHHYLAAVPDAPPAKAAKLGRRAGQQAARLRAFSDAVAYFRLALDAHPSAESGERADLLIDSGDAMWRGGDLDGARGVLAEAASLARASGDPERFAAAVLAAAGGHGGNAPLASADHGLIVDLDAALAFLPAEDSALRCRLLGRLAVELYLTDEVGRRTELSAEAVAMARRLADDACLAGALYARQMATLGPDGLVERAAATDEILRLAQRSGDRELALWGHLFRVWVLAAKCEQIDDELALCARLAAELGLSGYVAEVAMRQTVTAYLAGAHHRVAELMAAVEAGATTDLAVASSRTALVSLEYALKGPYDQLDGLVRATIVAQPDKVMWRAALLSVLIELDRLDDARQAFDELEATGFAVPRDGLWMHAMYCLGCACFAAGAGEHAASLRQLIAPFRDQAPLASFGSMLTPLGLVEAADGRFDVGVDLLTQAIERDLHVGNRAYALYTQRELGAVLLARDRLGDRQRAADLLAATRDELTRHGFSGLVARTVRLLDAATTAPRIDHRGRLPHVELRREGAAWMATFRGNTTCLPATKGVDDLAELLRNPGIEIAAIDLAGVTSAAATGPVLDPTAKLQFKARLDDLDGELAEAEEFADLGRAERLRAERDHLVHELAAAFGLGGRARHTGDVRERARQSVTWRIRHAIKTIDSIDPDLAAHLHATMRTGSQCAYVPDAVE